MNELSGLEPPPSPLNASLHRPTIISVAANRDQNEGNKEEKKSRSPSAAQRKPSPAVCVSVLNIKRGPDDLSLCLSSSDTSSLGVTSPMKRLICSQRGLLPAEELRRKHSAVYEAIVPETGQRRGDRGSHNV